MQDRMPSGFTRVLRLPLREPMEGDELHSSILQLAFGYHYNYEMTFPSLNEVSVLIQYAKHLSLPSQSNPTPFKTYLTAWVVETVRTAQALSAALECTFQFPTSKSRLYPVDDPDILLVALVIVATKLLFPFRCSQVPPFYYKGVSVLRLDWDKWAEAQQDSGGFTLPSRSKTSFNDISADKVITMTDEELASYFSRVASLIETKSKQRHPDLKRRPTHGPFSRP